MISIHFLLFHNIHIDLVCYLHAEKRLNQAVHHKNPEELYFRHSPITIHLKRISSPRGTLYRIYPTSTLPIYPPCKDKDRKHTKGPHDHILIGTIRLTEVTLFFTLLDDILRKWFMKALQLYIAIKTEVSKEQV